MSGQHEDVVSLSTRRTVPDAEPAPGPVNTHPGPDFAPREAA